MIIRSNFANAALRNARNPQAYHRFDWRKHSSLLQSRRSFCRVLSALRNNAETARILLNMWLISGAWLGCRSVGQSSNLSQHTLRHTLVSCNGFAFGNGRRYRQYESEPGLGCKAGEPVGGHNVSQRAS